MTKNDQPKKTKDPNRQKIGKRSRRKGRAFEQDIARKLRPFWKDAGRGIAQSRFGRGEAPDVDKCPPFWFECKHGKKPNIREALRQAVTAMRDANRDQDRWPVAIVKDDREKPMVIMPLDTFMELVEEWVERGRE